MRKFLTAILLAGLSCSATPTRTISSSAFVHLDHTYNTVHDEKFKTQLSAGGFILNPKSREHPGSLLCHFVFIGPPAITHQPRYLEFCQIRDRQAYVDEQKTDENFDMKNIDQRLIIKGLSFGYTADFRDYVKILNEQSPQVKSDYSHKNFNWKENSTDHLPGWGFIEFPRAPLQQDLYIWFTHRDQTTDPYSEEQHPNGARKIVGAVIDLSSEPEIRFLESVTLKKFVGARLQLEDGFQIFNFDRLGESEKKLFAKEQATYKAVLIETDPQKLDALAIPYEKTLFQGKKVKKVRFANFNWDAILIRGEANP